MPTNLQLGSSKETDANCDDLASENADRLTVSTSCELGVNGDNLSEIDFREETARETEETNVGSNDQESELGDHLTIYNPHESSEDSSDFPEVNSPEPQNEKTYQYIADEGYQEIIKQGIKNDIVLGELLQHYSDGFDDKQKQKAKLKRNFFLWIMILLSIVTLGCFALPILAIILTKDMTTIIASASVSVIEFSIAFLKLPQIVAEYLFDKEEDKAMAQFVSNTQEYTIKRTNHRL